MLPKVLVILPAGIYWISNVAVKIAGGVLRPCSLEGSSNYKNWHDAITGEDKWKEAVQAYLASIYFVDKQLGRVLGALEQSPHRENTILYSGAIMGGCWERRKPGASIGLGRIR